MATLAIYEPGRENNYNLLRFCAASLVLWTHSYALVFGSGDAEPLRSLLGMTAGDVAVDVFFVISGFLVTRSFFQRKDLRAYCRARAMRIFPGLLVSVVLTVFTAGLFFTTLELGDFLLNPETTAYLLKNTFLLFGVSYTLPGVFTELPYGGVVNGSLWTLPYELRFYLLFPGLFLFFEAVRKRNGLRCSLECFSLLLAVVALLLNTVNQFIPLASPRFSQLLTMYGLGVAAYCRRESIVLSGYIVVLLVVLAGCAVQIEGLFRPFYCLALAYLVLYLAYVPDGVIRHFNRLGDYSYGLYIYAFPVQQSVIALVPGISVSGVLIVSGVITLVLAVLSWHLVEARCLRWKERETALERLLVNLCYWNRRPA